MKTFEKIVKLTAFLEKIVKLTAFLETSQVMNPTKHDFRAHRSCLSELLSHDELIIAELESKCYADVIYLDFVKAFDKDDHGILMKKCANRMFPMSWECGFTISYQVESNALQSTELCQRNPP